MMSNGGGSGTADRAPRFSRRESQVLELRRRGLTRKEIANALGISVSSVREYLRAIFAKTRTRTSAEAVYVITRIETRARDDSEFRFTVPIIVIR